VLGKAWTGICAFAKECDNAYYKLPRRFFFQDLFPSTGVIDFKDLPDPFSPEIRQLLNAYGETLVADRNGLICRKCYYCDNIVLVRFEHFNYTQYWYWGYPKYVCHNAYSHRLTNVLYLCYFMGFWLAPAGPPMVFFWFALVPAFLKI
jgi:hypothetical protein